MGKAFLDCSNSYVVVGELVLLIDPGRFKSYPNLLGLMTNDKIKKENLDVVLITHSHIDHCESNVMFKAIKSFYPLKKQPDISLSELEDIMNFETVHTPGHSEDSISLYLQDFDAAIVGDIISEAGVGRFDLPGSDPKKFLRSIDRIQKLDANYLLPGHGRILVGKEGINLLFEKAKIVLENFIEYL